jgi:hypothetical protein
MARFYYIQIADIYLSSDGTAGGERVKCEVVGWRDLLSPVTGNTRKNADGSNDNQRYAWDAGKDFEIRVSTWIYQAQWDDLKALLLDSQANGTTFQVVGTGDFGNFNVPSEAQLDAPFDAANFRNGRIFQPVFRLSTV